MAEWYEDINSSTGKFVASQTTASGTGTPIHIPGNLDSCVITAKPTGSCEVQYTFDSNYVVNQGSGVNWQLWEAGAVTALTFSLFGMSPTAVRLNNVTGGSATLTVTSVRG